MRVVNGLDLFNEMSALTKCMDALSEIAAHCEQMAAKETIEAERRQHEAEDDGA